MDGDSVENKEFGNRLAELRENKNVSAREMSLSIGQSGSYINKIENHNNYPSMNIFFYICDFLEITPEEFFNYDNTLITAKINLSTFESLKCSPKLKEPLINALNKCSDEQIQNFIDFVNGFDD